MDELKGKARDLLGGFLSQDQLSALLGESEGKVQLPSIPEVQKDATSTVIYSKAFKDLEKRGEAFNSLSENEKRKYRVAFIQEVYQVTRNSEPKEEDVIKFLNVLEQGGSREGVYRAIVLDSVYSSLENYEEVPSDKLKSFAVKFGEKYLNRKFSSDAMDRLNLWSIKRITVEKTLEVMDALALKPEDLFSWYAVLSSELARNYPGLWKNQVRQIKEASTHLRWAQTVPLQQIKSETIIKLHEVMNTLNE